MFSFLQVALDRWREALSEDSFATAAPDKLLGRDDVPANTRTLGGAGPATVFFLMGNIHGVLIL